MKEIVEKVWICLFEIFTWFIYLWMGALAIACTCELPKQGIITLICAIVLTLTTKIYKKFKKN